MADMDFDAVIIGGGNKGLVTAMYLAKYGKMKVGIFEERHELGGGWGSHEAPAPGFLGNTHASTLADWYLLPLQRDFPDIEEKGLKLLHQKCGMGIILKEDHSCLPFYHHSEDPTGEMTIKAVERFAGSKDAETWWKMYEAMGPKGGLLDAWLTEVYSLPPMDGTPGPFQQWFMNEMKRPGSLVNPRLLALPANYAVKEIWGHPGLQYNFLRFAKAAGYPTEAAGGPVLFIVPLSLIGMAFAKGGTHSIAHACIRVFLENGGKFFTKSKVDRILVENGKTSGIRLADGTEIRSKIVVSGADPYQLCFDLIGAEHVPDSTARRVANLERSLTCITWYTWALEESINYKASDYDPDINHTHWVLLASQDVESLVNEAYYRRLNMTPPALEIVNFHHHSTVDDTQAPDGMHIVGSEIHTVPASAMNERQWMEFKVRHAEETMGIWKQYTKNMDWDKVIGYDPITPFDIAARQRNFGPAGNWNVLDRIPGQMAPFLPVQEWADHKIRPLENLYGTGSGWGFMNGGLSSQGYTCYKAIAADLGLAQPWDGQPW